ncbi:MAG: hypothetical protein IT177_11655 [Acidobacteria bacterium]|nr:hypothetical protein [Acidobacteriota bacterium]
MAGKPGRSGGANALSLHEHVIKGTFRPDRHASLTARQPDPQPVSSADRRRTLAGLDSEARRLAGRILDEHGDWTPTDLVTLRLYVESVSRVAAATDDGERRREVRIMLGLLKALDLGAAK